MSGHRRSAVAIHALSEADRCWVLAELPHEERATIEQFIAELDQLGFSPEDSAAVQAVAGSVAPGQEVLLGQRMAHASADQMFAVLEMEPTTLIVDLLSIEQWAWTEEFVQMLPAASQVRVRSALSSSSPCAPAKRRYLVTACESRLGQIQPRDASSLVAGIEVPVRTSIFSPLQRLVKLWK